MQIIFPYEAQACKRGTYLMNFFMIIKCREQDTLAQVHESLDKLSAR